MKPVGEQTDTELETARKRAIKSRDSANDRVLTIGHERRLRRDAKQCQTGKFSNTRCMLALGHPGLHEVPCTWANAHRAHREVGPTSIVDCPGRAFDLT